MSFCAPLNSYSKQTLSDRLGKYDSDVEVDWDDFTDWLNKIEANNLGGFEGGMTNGENIELTAYLKPISTTLSPIKSVNLAEKEETETVYERSDTCAVPRAVPIFESAMALEILNAVLNKTGGDNKKEIIKNFEAITNLNIDEFDLNNKVWKFGYESE